MRVGEERQFKKAICPPYKDFFNQIVTFTEVILVTRHLTKTISTSGCNRWVFDRQLTIKILVWKVKSWLTLMSRKREIVYGMGKYKY